MFARIFLTEDEVLLD